VTHTQHIHCHAVKACNSNQIGASSGAAKTLSRENPVSCPHSSQRTNQNVSPEPGKGEAEEVGKKKKAWRKILQALEM
jgi:hypothetical protein